MAKPISNPAPPRPHAGGKVRHLRRIVPTISFALALVSLSLTLRLAPHTLSMRASPSTSSGVRPAAAPGPPTVLSRFGVLWRGRGPTLRPPPANYPHKCHVVGWDPARGVDWGSNARAFCLTSAVCIRPSTRASNSALYTGARPIDTSCSVAHPSLRALEPQPDVDCMRIQRRHVHCAHGKYQAFSQPHCPVQHTLSDLPARETRRLRWRDDDEIGVVVPALPFSRNIFHFSYVAALVSHVVAALPDLQRDWLAPLHNGSAASATDLARASLRGARVHVVLRGKAVTHVWQRTVLDALLAPHRAQYRALRVSWLGEASRGGSVSGKNTRDALCFRRAVLLDARRNLNAWPFANGTSVSHAGDTVPAQSVLFRRAVLDAVGIPSNLPLRLPRDGARLVFPLPPRVVGYSRREMAGAIPPGQNVSHGLTRRLLPADEAWFRRMLSEEATHAGMQVREFRLSARDSVAAQVDAMHALGVVVGIHGSNLVNAMWMRPFGALVELFPGRTNPRNMPCYVAGMNAGLFYRWHEAPAASREESGCLRDDSACWSHPRGRLVKLSASADRAAVRRKVADAIARIARLHDAFPDGVPVRYDGVVGEFVIDDEGIDDDAGNDFV